MARKKPKANKTVYTRVEEKKKGINKRKALVIFVSVFLGVVILAGGILGISVAVRNAGYFVSYDGIGVDDGVVCYLTSYYKGDYMALMSSAGVKNVEDTETFWASARYTREDGTEYTYGEDMKNYALLGIKTLLAANKLFDTYTSLTSEDRQTINDAVREILDYRAQGSVDTFNQNTEKYGYDYNDFKTATTMLYKSAVVKDRICGEGGANLKSQTSGELASYCESFYGSYSHVNLIFVRTETTFVLDEEGNRVRDEENNDTLRDLSDEEKAERVERIALLKECINGINSGEVAPERFYELMALYDEGDADSHNKGYYFHPYADYTAEFSEAFEDVVNTSYVLNIGEAAAVECDIGICFIYKLANSEDAYTDSSEDWCFSDFYAIAADEFYTELITDHRKNVTEKDAWETFDAEAVPYSDGTYTARF